MLASMTALPTSASSFNDYELTYTTLTEALTTNDGSIIPAGAVAISASIDGNTGFNANTIKLDTGSNCTVITDVDGNPVIETGSALNDAMIGMAVNNDTVCVTTALAQSCMSNGNLFTFFVIPDTLFDTEDVSIIDVQQETEQASSMQGLNQGMMNPGSNGLNSVMDPVTHVFYIKRGDVNNNNVVNSADATVIMQVYANASCKYDDDPSTILSKFPSCLVWYQADANGDEIVSHIKPNLPELSDAKTILMYAASVGVGVPYTGYGHQTVGKWYNTATDQQEDPNFI